MSRSREREVGRAAVEAPQRAQPESHLAADADAEAGTRSQIRGSSLLFVGQGIAVLVNLAIQVMIVRSLSRGEYGAFAYGLSVVTIAEPLTTFGLDQAIARFASLYREQEDYRRLWGAILLVVGLTAAVGLALIIAFHGLSGLVGEYVMDDDLALSLLLVLIVLAPVQGLDNVMVGLFSVFARPRTIFFRRFVLTPALRLSVVLVLVLQGLGPRFLAAGWVAAGALGLVVYSVVLFQIWRRSGLLARLRLRAIQVPLRDMLAFAVPILSASLFYVALLGADAVMLGHFHGPTEVGAIRAVQPIGQANQLVMYTFGLLFIPLATRLYHRDDLAGMNHAFWSTTSWIAVLGLPVLLGSFALAGPVTVLLFGDRYAGSAPLLALLALGFYLDATLGLNALSLRIFRRLRAVVAVDVVCTVVNLTTNILLIPRFGALGAAITTCGSLLLHMTLNQLAARRALGIGLAPPRERALLLSILAAAGGLLAVQLLLDPPLALSVLLAVGLTLLVLRGARSCLRAAEIFPELDRIPLLRKLVIDPLSAGDRDR